jgi:hypothetical protein
VYAGKLLILQRRIYVGHSPITYAKKTRVATGRSENGQLLGRIVLSESSQTVVELPHLTPDWFRTYMTPFLDFAKEFPFFFAWRPSTYPNEVGYAWMLNDPAMTNQLGNGFVKTSLELGGIAP